MLHIIKSSTFTCLAAALLFSICSSCKIQKSESDDKAVRNGPGSRVSQDNLEQTVQTVIGAVQSKESYYTVVSCRDIDSFLKLKSKIKEKNMSGSEITDFVYKQFSPCNFIFRELDPNIKAPVFMDGKDISLLKSICQSPLCDLRTDVCVSILDDVFSDKIKGDYLIERSPNEYRFFHNIELTGKVVKACYSGYLKLKAENKK